MVQLSDQDVSLLMYFWHVYLGGDPGPITQGLPFTHPTWPGDASGSPRSSMWMWLRLPYLACIHQNHIKR